MPYPIFSISIGAISAFIAATLVGSIVGASVIPLPSNEDRTGCIDGLRGYLALSVFVHHFIIWMQVSRLDGGWLPPKVFFFNQLGAGGVALFFMTTGFVFYPRMLAGFRNCSWLAIYTARVFRIMPLVIVSVAIVTAVIAARTGHGLDSAFPLSALTWISTWGEPPLLDYPDSGRLNAYVLWSLWYEWLFYLLVLPACAFAMDLTRGKLPSWVVPVALLTVAVAARSFRPLGSMVRYLPLFAIGMLAYECQRHAQIRRALQTPAAAIAAVAALGFGMIAAPTPYQSAMPLFGFFFACVACGNSLGGILKTRGALVLGQCSYGIYLLHGIVLSVVFVDTTTLTGSLTTAQLPLLLPLTAMLIVLITPVTHLLVERPAISLGRQLIARWSGRRFRPGAPELEVAP